MNDFTLPETRYALSGDVNIAYQTMGTGPVDIIMVPGFVSHVEFTHELAGYTAFLRRLSSFARVVTFDKRGQGLSDRITGAPSLEQRMDDVRAVMDEVGSQRAVVVGFSEGSAMSALFTATYPERVAQLVLFGGYAAAPFLLNGVEERIARVAKAWGTVDDEDRYPEPGGKPGRCKPVRQAGTALRQSGCSQSDLAVERADRHQPILPAVQVPTLVLHRRTDARVPNRGWPRSGGANPQCPLYRISGRRSRFLVWQRRGVARRHRGVCHGTP
jgi:pimeloyl-ACP methyl ester carboxylesterase